MNYYLLGLAFCYETFVCFQFKYNVNVVRFFRFANEMCLYTAIANYLNNIVSTAAVGQLMFMATITDEHVFFTVVVRNLKENLPILIIPQKYISDIKTTVNLHLRSLVLDMELLRLLTSLAS